MFPIAFITDEATQSLDEAIALAKEKGLQGLELRSVDDTPIDRIDPETLKLWAKRIREAGLSVPCIAGSFYKAVLSEADVPELERQKLDRLIQAALILGAPLIRGFAGLKEEVSLDTIVTWFEDVTPKLKAQGLKLCLEADPHVNTSNHAQIAELLDKLDPTTYGAIYDPGNCLYDPLGENPFPEGYRAIAKRIAHVHIKDVVIDAKGEPQCLKVGTGSVPFPDILQALLEDGYTGWISLETHYRKEVTLTDEQMLHPQGTQFSLGGMAAMRESVESLQDMIAELQAAQKDPS